MLSRTLVLSRSATVTGTRNSAMVRPRSAAVEGWSLGMAIVIWAPRIGGHASGDRPADSSRASVVLNGPDDRQAACDARRICRRQHRDGDAEDERQADDRPRDPARDIEAATRQDDHQRPDDETERDAEQGAGQAEDAGLDDDRPPDLAAGHPGGTEDADLADPLDDVHGQRVDDAECRDEDRDRGQRIEQAEDAPEGVADGALDPIERHDLEGERGRLGSECVAGRGRGARYEADGEDVRAS